MPKRILIVEDEIVVRRAIRAFLELHHFEICGEAVNGVEALEKAAALRPDLITLDLSMPFMRGMERSKVMRSGRSAAAFSRASTPLTASPQISKWWSSRNARMARRTTISSSTTRMRLDIGNWTEANHSGRGRQVRQRPYCRQSGPKRGLRRCSTDTTRSKSRFYLATGGWTSVVDARSASMRARRMARPSDLETIAATPRADASDLPRTSPNIVYTTMGTRGNLERSKEAASMPFMWGMERSRMTMSG